jgi:hypothetical protein
MVPSKVTSPRYRSYKKRQTPRTPNVEKDATAARKARRNRSRTPVPTLKLPTLLISDSAKPARAANRKPLKPPTKSTGKAQPKSVPAARQISPRGTPEDQADVIKHWTLPGALITVQRGFRKRVGMKGYRKYLDDFLKAAGNPTDPIVVGLIEDHVLGRFRATALHVQAAEMKKPTNIAMLSNAAVRLMAVNMDYGLAIKELQGRLTSDARR